MEIVEGLGFRYGSMEIVEGLGFRVKGLGMDQWKLLRV